MRAATAGALILAASPLSTACTSSGHSHSTAAAPTSLGTTTTAVTTGASPATNSTTGPTTTAAATAACAASQLRIVESGSGGAAGTVELTFSLTDTAGPCTMRGYPGMQLLSASGGALPTHVVRGGGLAFESLPVTTVSLGSGQVAYFNVGYSDVQTGTSTCVQAAKVEVTPPNATDFARVALDGSLNACNGATLHVSPVFASTDSAATQTTVS